MQQREVLMCQMNVPKFFGRRKGRVLHKTKSVLLARFLPKIKIGLNTFFDKKSLFGKPVQKVCLEIGFGDGAHLAGLSYKQPDVGFIGVEVFQNGVANLLNLLTGVKEGNHIPEDICLLPEREDNVRVFDDDVRLLFPQIPDGFIDKVYLLFPDPWPKKKHAARRFVNPGNLKELARIISPGGVLQIATDHKIYKSWVLHTMHDNPDFKWMAKTSNDWRYPPVDWVETKYQKKAVREGRKPVFFEYERV